MTYSADMYTSLYHSFGPWC